MEIYIKGIDGTLLKVPVNPESIEVNENHKIEVVEVLGAGEIPIPGFSELQSLSWESFLPTVKDGNYTEGKADALGFINKLRAWKNANQPVRLVISGLFGKNLKAGNVNQLYYISDFKTKTKYGYHNDIVYSIKLVEHKKLEPRKLEVPKPKPEQPKPIAILKPPTPTPPRKPTTPPAPKPRTHTVVWGDTLWGISRKFYGDGAQWRKIYNANKDKIKNPDLIYPGQVFTVP